MTPDVLAAVGAAPVAPAISTLGAVLSFVLAVALAVMWFQILRGPLVRIANISILTKHPFGFLTSVISNVDHWLNSTVAGTERAVTWSFHSLMWSLSTTAHLTEDLARSTWQALEWERKHTTRHVSAPVPQSIEPRIKKLEGEWKGIDHRVDQIEHREQVKKGAGAAAGAVDSKTFDTFKHGINDRVGKLEKEYHGIEHAQTNVGAKARPGAVPVPRVAPRVVPRSKPATRNWTSVFTKLGATALVVAALGRMGLSWLRCPSLLRTGKRLGCSGFGLLEELLAASFVPFILTDACKIMHLIEGIAVKVEPEIAALVLGIEGFVCGGVDNLPSGIVPGDLKRVGASASSL